MFTQNLNRRGIQAFSHGLLTCEGVSSCAEKKWTFFTKILTWIAFFLGLCVFAGMKVNGGSSQQDWLFVNFSNPDSLIGTSLIWRSKIDPCTVTSSKCSGSPDDYYLLILTQQDSFYFLLPCLFFFPGGGKVVLYHHNGAFFLPISPQYTASSITLRAE